MCLRLLDRTKVVYRTLPQMKALRRRSPFYIGHAPVNPFPYQADEVIGGDSVLSIQQRLLQKFGNPSSEEIDRARIEAEDLFEVKVDIIRQMETLDPGGDWERRGARALDNPRTATGEELLERLYEIRDNLNRDGIQSPTFRSLQKKNIC